MGCAIVILLLVILLLLAGPSLVTIGGIVVLFAKVDEWTKGWNAIVWLAFAALCLGVLLVFLRWLMNPRAARGGAHSKRNPVSPVDDYRKWTRRQWNDWKSEEDLKEPIPDDPNKWRPGDADRYKKQELMRLLETPLDSPTGDVPTKKRTVPKRTRKAK